MKTKKIIALMLSLAMVLGFAACTETPAETSASDTSAADTSAADSSEATEATTEAFSYKENEVKTVSDEGSELTVWGWNEEGCGLIEKYSDVKITKVIGNSDTYQQTLDNALSSGEDAPDLFFLEAAYAKKYLNTTDVVSLNDLGIKYDEFMADSYDYVIRAAADDSGVIKGLSWQGCPAGVYFNRNIAKEYFGTDDIAEIQKLFTSWDTVLETARTLNTKSEGKVKIMAGPDDIWECIKSGRSQGWVVDGEVKIAPEMDAFFDLTKTLYDEELTFNAPMWQDAWNADAANNTVFTYWGPMWLSWSLNFRDASKNPTSGQWGFVNAPSSYFWGGTWIAATKYCDMKASSAQIIRDLCIDKDTLNDMCKGGEFVNSKSIMNAAANDASFSYDFLGGQNPLKNLCEIADTIDYSVIQKDDNKINDLFSAAAAAYYKGDVDSVAAAKEVFYQSVADAGL